MQEQSVKYSLRKDSNGKTFVDVDSSIYNEDDGTSVASVIASIIKNKFNNIINANGQSIRINATTNAEWRRSENATKLMKASPVAYNDKLNVIANADEILRAARNWIGEKKHHKNNNKFIEYARGNVRYRVKENGYTADVIVGITTDSSAVLYDLVNIYETKIVEAPVSKVTNSYLSRQNASTTKNISHSNKDVNNNIQHQDRNATQLDRDYMSAVKHGDTETAQKMVDEAAERVFANSKIRDESGKLLKVYHGSESDFTVFDRTKGRSGADIQGMFFSPWELDAQGYGSNVRTFYINIQNPASESIGYKALNKYTKENYRGIKAREECQL